MPDSGKGGTCGRIFWRALVSGLENLAVIPAFLMLQLPKKNKPSYGERRFELLGRGPFIPDGQKTVWIHTVSVGETLGAASFIKLLAARCPDLHIGRLRPARQPRQSPSKASRSTASRLSTQGLRSSHSSGECILRRSLLWRPSSGPRCLSPRKGTAFR